MMNAVIGEYGEPTDKTLPIGQPAITRWMYDTFTVVFETDHVVHAFARVNTVENRALAEIPERPDFVSMIDQTRNKPGAAVQRLSRCKALPQPTHRKSKSKAPTKRQTQ